MLIGAEQTRSACLRAGQAYLDKYWRQLREHAAKNFVKPREPEAIFTELSAKLENANQVLLRETLTRTPFANER